MAIIFHIYSSRYGYRRLHRMTGDVVAVVVAVASRQRRINGVLNAALAVFAVTTAAPVIRIMDKLLDLDKGIQHGSRHRHLHVGQNRPGVDVCAVAQSRKPAGPATNRRTSGRKNLRYFRGVPGRAAPAAAARPFDEAIDVANSGESPISSRHPFWSGLKISFCTVARNSARDIIFNSNREDFHMRKLVAIVALALGIGLGVLSNPAPGQPVPVVCSNGLHSDQEARQAIRDQVPNARVTEYTGGRREKINAALEEVLKQEMPENDAIWFLVYPEDNSFRVVLLKDSCVVVVSNQLAPHLRERILSLAFGQPV